jgi:hypothetical protein
MNNLVLTVKRKEVILKLLLHYWVYKINMKIKIAILFSALLLILRYIEITLSLNLLLYLHDIFIYLSTIIILCGYLYFKRTYLSNLFKRFENIYVRYLNLVLFFIMLVVLLVFSINNITTLLNYLISVDFNNIEKLVINELYGKNFSVFSYLINFLPLVIIYIFYDNNTEQILN